MYIHSSLKRHWVPTFWLFMNNTYCLNTYHMKFKVKPRALMLAPRTPEDETISTQAD